MLPSLYGTRRPVPSSLGDLLPSFVTPEACSLKGLGRKNEDLIYVDEKGRKRGGGVTCA